MANLKVEFSTHLEYLFDATYNPRFAGAAHVKVEIPSDPRCEHEVLFVALDGERRVAELFAFCAESALKPMTVEYMLDEGSENEIDSARILH